MLVSALVLGCASAVLASSGYLKLDLEHVQGPRLVKRQTNTDHLGQQIVAGENGSLYWLNLTIGTPPQSFRLQLDTGSSDVVVTNSKVKECKKEGGCPSGSYDPGSSSTYELVSEGTFNNSYGDGTAYIGDYFTDVLSVGGIDIKAGDLIVGLANQLEDGPQLVNDGTGLVGVGYQANSGAVVLTLQNNTLPSTVISAMVSSGDIGRQAYSLYLGSQEAAKGRIIFGGIDPSLYTGDLVALPVLKDPVQYAEYTDFKVALTGVSVTDESGTRLLTDTDFAMPVLLDSGNTVTNLPSSLVDAVYGGFGITSIEGSATIPCSRNRANASLTYHFGGGDDGPSINVPLSALIAPLSEPAQFSDGQDICQFKVDVPNGDTLVLGDSFMRSGYFVFDLDNNQVALAQAATSSVAGSSGSISAIMSGTDIPGCSSTNTFSIDVSSATLSDEGGPAAATSDNAEATGSINPVTPTFDLGAAATETANESGSSGGSGGSSGSASSSGSGIGSGNAAPSVRVPSTVVVAGSSVVALAVGFAMVLL
ncbi:uncharacterized protein HMPREF1541_02296 [Cyphellophora europaea CBS 101466]|uniref:Peptidase A1 domain-containing protein n=1 Tax=Cyphellophora europaea (strain CBS 101466) TaxID=1220924 RepID=W2S513_CYPE1|nr:uncharacterized protein HMPREF1541_02296 [Cyphellophora europaea CBS 101466]ETN43138.1 hypothetical protein HMPREF1541_02296 [Cyphellophora europaea CBS 101466]